MSKMKKEVGEIATKLAHVILRSWDILPEEVRIELKQVYAELDDLYMKEDDSN